MADANALVQRVYDIKVLGADAGLKSIVKLTDAFGRMDTIKKKLNASLGQKISASADAKAIQDLENKIKQLEERMDAYRAKVDQILSSTKRTTPEFKAGAAATRDWSQEITTTSQKLTELKQKLADVNAAIKNYKASGATDNSLQSLTAEQSALKISIQQTNQQLNNQVREVLTANGSINSMRAQLNLLNMAFDNLDAEIRDGAFGQDLLKQIQALDTELKRVEFSTGRYGRNVGNYTSTFSGLQNSINQITRELPAASVSLQTFFLGISNNLPIFYDELVKTNKQIQVLRAQGEKVPGLFSQLSRSFISFGTILSLGITGLTLYAQRIVELISNAIKSKPKLDALKVSQDALNKSMEESSGSFQEATKAITEMLTNIDLAKKGLLSKTEVLKQYNEGLGKVMGEVKSLDEAEKKLVENGEAYVKMQLYKAAANLALQDAAAKAYEVEKRRQKQAEDFLTGGDKFAETGTRNAYAAGGSLLATQMNKQADKLRAEQAKKRKEAAIKEGEEEVKTFKDIAAKFQADAAKIAQENGFSFFDPKKGGKDNSDQLADEYRKALYELQKIDKEGQTANYQTIMNNEQNSFNIRIGATEKYYEKVKELADLDMNYQLASIERKGRTEEQIKAQEAVIHARYNQEEKTRTIEHDNQMFDLKKQSAEKALAYALEAAERERQAVENNPASTEVQKLNAQQTYQEKAYVAQMTFNKLMLKLENEYGKYSVENERKRAQAVSEILAALGFLQIKTTRAVFEQQLKALNDKAEEQINNIKSRVAKEVGAILEDGSLGPKTKAYQIEAAEERAAGDALLAEKQRTEEQYNALAKSGLASREELSAARRAMEEADTAFVQHQAKIQQGAMSSIVGWFKDGVNNITSFFKGVKATRQQIDDAVNAGVENVKAAVVTAYNAYFEGKQNQIEKEKEVAIQRLTIEESQVLAQAQSEEEKESIRAQYEQKRKQAEKKAAEEKKKLALQQMTIDFGVAAIKTLQGYVFPWSLIPLAGLTALYFAQRAQVQNAQFAKGGKVPKLRHFATGGQVPKLSAGMIDSAPNIPAQTNGDNVLATVRTGEVILNQEQQRKLGGAATFKKIGVPGFASGGMISPAFGSGYFGESLRAPMNTQAYLSGRSGGQVADSGELSKNVELLMHGLNEVSTQTNQRIDRIRVQVVAKDVDDMIQKMKRAHILGVI